MRPVPVTLAARLSLAFRGAILATAFVTPAGGREESVRGAGAATLDNAAAFVLRQARGDSGLCVHIGCGNGRLTAALAGGKFLVHGLEPDRAQADAARAFIRSSGLYGQASVESGPIGRLPYADNLVNLLVVDNLPRMLEQGVTLGEIQRVLCPQGVAAFGPGPATGSAASMEEQLKKALADAGIEEYGIVRENGVWAIVGKPRPAGMDEWTHFRHGPEGSGVSLDRLGPLSSPRWITGPAVDWGACSALVSAQGCNFYIVDGALASRFFAQGTFIAPRYLVARDAFNGLPLWVRPYDRRSSDMMRYNRNSVYWLAASDNTVITLQDGEVVALDAKSGELVKKLAALGDQRSAKLLFQNGRLVLQNRKELRCVDSASADLLWKRAALDCQAAALVGDRLVWVDSNTLVQAEMKSGQDVWRKEIMPGARPIATPTLFHKAGRLVLASRQLSGATSVLAFALEDGKVLWRYDAPDVQPGASYGDQLVWIRRRIQNKDKVFYHLQWEGLDPASGEVRRTFTAPDASGGCTVDNVDVATERYFIYRRPASFLEWASGSMVPFKAVRSGCGVGGVPANGLYYGFPNKCMCLGVAEVRGFTAFAPKSQSDPGNDDDASPSRIQRGTDSVSSHVVPGESPADEWPTFLHDTRRSGSCSEAIPNELQLLWQTRIDDPSRPSLLLAGEWTAKPGGADALTSPVVAGNLVVLGVKDGHRMVACDAATGHFKWDYVSGGRLDTPPTLYQGLCLFGCRDGWVYCLAAVDGRLLWRFRAAPAEKRIMAYGQLESPWPVVGGITVENGMACVVAGRSAAVVDGDIRLYGLEPLTGKVCWSAKGSAADLLVSKGVGFSIGGTHDLFDSRTGKSIKPNRGGLPGQQPGLQALGMGMLLDYSWQPIRGIMNRFHVRSFAGVTGQTVVCDDRRVYAYRRTGPRTGELEARDPAAPAKDACAWKLPIAEQHQIEALAVAGDKLLAAGPVAGTNSVTGELWVIGAATGDKLVSLSLPSAPVSDGLAVASGRIYLPTRDGTLRCFGKKD